MLKTQIGRQAIRCKDIHRGIIGDFSWKIEHEDLPHASNLRHRAFQFSHPASVAGPHQGRQNANSPNDGKQWWQKRDRSVKNAAEPDRAIYPRRIVQKVVDTISRRG